MDKWNSCTSLSLQTYIVAMLPSAPFKPSSPTSSPSSPVYLLPSPVTFGTCSFPKSSYCSTSSANPPSRQACQPWHTSMAPSTTMPPLSYHSAAPSSSTTSQPPAATETACGIDDTMAAVMSKGDANVESVSSLHWQCKWCSGLQV